MTFTTYASLARPGDIWLDKRIVGIKRHQNMVQIQTTPAAGGHFGQLDTVERDEKDRITLYR